jgi:hypothetical protein
MPRKQKNGSNNIRDMPLGRGHGADHVWTAPTPVSLRREEAQRRGEAVATPRPALARHPIRVGSRDLTPDELTKIAERSRSMVLVTAEEHKTHKQHARGMPHTILDHVTPGRR